MCTRLNKGKISLLQMLITVTFGKCKTSHISAFRSYKLLKILENIYVDWERNSQISQNISKYALDRKQQDTTSAVPLDDELLCRVKQVAMNNPFVNNLQIWSDCLRPQSK